MELKINDRNRKLPDFLIVGAGKSGTTSLHYYLLNHPQIFLPKEIKETLFFHITTNPNKEQLKYAKGILNFEDYLSLFDGASDDQICGEVCPSYLYYYDLTIENIKRYHPRWRDVKIIIILREPISKIISHYYFIKNTVKIPEKSLKETLRLEQERLKANNVLPDLFLVDNTRYYNQVKAYIDNFEHVKILFYDDLLKDQNALMEDLLKFIGVDHNMTPPNMSKRYNVSKRNFVPRNAIVKFLFQIYSKSFIRFSKQSKLKLILKNLFSKKEVTDSDIAYLKKIFRPEVDRLRELLNNDLKSWNY